MCKILWTLSPFCDQEKNCFPGNRIRNRLCKGAYLKREVLEMFKSDCFILRTKQDKQKRETLMQKWVLWNASCARYENVRLIGPKQPWSQFFLWILSATFRVIFFILTLKRCFPQILYRFLQDYISIFETKKFQVCYNIEIETDWKKLYWPKNILIIKNPQFFFNPHQIWSKW